MEGICRLCGTTTSKRRAQTHVRQYFRLYWCSCGFQNIRKDQLYEHITQQRTKFAHLEAEIYMVDRESHPTLTQLMQWKDPSRFTLPLPYRTLKHDTTH